MPHEAYQLDYMSAMHTIDWVLNIPVIRKIFILNVEVDEVADLFGARRHCLPTYGSSFISSEGPRWLLTLLRYAASTFDGIT